MDYHAIREWTLEASPQALWLFVSNSHRRNYENGNPPLRSALPSGERLPNAFRLVKASLSEFEERPFEWVRPQYFVSFQRFTRLRIVEHVRVRIDLLPLPAGGTRLTCDVRARPTSRLTWLLAAWLGQRILNGLDDSLQRYAQAALRPAPSLFSLPPAKPPRFAPNGRQRLSEAHARLLEQGGQAELADRLVELLRTVDDLTVGRIRPYVLADHWGEPRHSVLTLCLQATRIGLLEFHWELLCPLCRGAKGRSASLDGLHRRMHCDTCNIDFEANFEWSVEMVFNPPLAIRSYELNPYCVSGPQNTPHIAVQQLIAPGEERQLHLELEAGRYRVRALELPGAQVVDVALSGPAQALFTLRDDGWPEGFSSLGTQAVLRIHNATRASQLFLLERMAWSDQAATAADVLATQAFRDLFSREALRPGEQISVGPAAVIFTDLCDSTRMYNQIGDAVAFGHVLHHFDHIKEAIDAEGGAIVKTIGDSVMAVFTRPAPAVRAVLRAREMLASSAWDGAVPLRLKVGIHYGPCIAVTLNDRLDYFGTTVNLASRLGDLAPQGGLVLSQAVLDDPETAAFLRAEALALTGMESELKGLAGRFRLALLL